MGAGGGWVLRGLARTRESACCLTAQWCDGEVGWHVPDGEAMVGLVGSFCSGGEEECGGGMETRRHDGQASGSCARMQEREREEVAIEMVLFALGR